VGVSNVCHDVARRENDIVPHDSALFTHFPKKVEKTRFAFFSADRNGEAANEPER
jgi:hypothetical protein